MDQKTNNPIKKVDVEILGKILVMLYESCTCRRSILARKCNMAYNKCMRYVDFLDLIGFIATKIDDEDFEIIILTESGIKFCKNKLSVDFAQNKNDEMFLR